MRARGTSLASVIVRVDDLIHRNVAGTTMHTPALSDRRGATPFRYYAWPGDEVLTALQTTRSGLTESEAIRRLDQYGLNRLDPAPPVSALRILRDQLSGIVVLLLIAAGVVSLLLGDRIEAAAIAAVLVINTLIGFSTELRARRAMEALLQLDSSHASVIRDGQLRTVPADTIVPGDIVRLDAGERVPADARLLEATEFQTDEAALTGESLPVSKRSDERLQDDTPLAERRTMVYKSTMVPSGTALAVVTETGAATEIGRVGTLVAGVEERRTPLEVRLDALGRRLAWIAIGVAGLIAILAGIQGAPLWLVLEMGIALAVAAVPEALPAVATIALAVGVHRMARRNALVRRLPAVEALGSTTVICTDKTRTLTTGLMTAVRLWTPDLDVSLDESEASGHEGVRRVLEAAALASRPQPVVADGERRGDPVDRAILSAAHRAGIDRTALVRQWPQVGLVPFASDRKLMASFHQVNSAPVIYAKGAPRQILDLCESLSIAGHLLPLEADRRQKLRALNETLARSGLRVLAVAKGESGEPSLAGVRALTFLGFIGLADPPAPGVKDAIARLRRAGLRTLMLTGDQRATASAVGRELNLVDDDHGIVDARELDRLSEAQLAARLEDVSGFSRITPEHKLMLVRALQARGDIVAMLGDGVNDAPALRQADVGVAMGVRGTDVAKEAAAIVLQDDRFATVVAAVEEGRVIFDNIRKFVFYLFSCNLAEILVLFVAAVSGLPVPLLPLQILWLNMVTDTFPALALALEPGDDQVMNRPPRDPQEALLSRRFLLRVAFYGLLITAATVAAYALSLGDGEDKARTIAFMTLAFAQILHLGNARSDDAVLQPVRVVANPFALAAVAVSVMLQFVAVGYAPLANVLRVSSLDLGDWALVLAIAAIPAVAGQAIKIVTAKRRSITTQAR